MMSDPSEAPNPSQQVSEDRRLMVRYPSKATVVVLRDSDRMRTGIEGKLKDVSVGGLSLLLPVAPELGEQIKIEIRNDIQRLRKETRGVVRHVTPLEDGSIHVGVELRARLNPLDVSLMKMSLPTGDGNRWL